MLLLGLQCISRKFSSSSVVSLFTWEKSSRASKGNAGRTVSKFGGGLPRQRLERVQVALRMVERRDCSLKV